MLENTNDVQQPDRRAARRAATKAEIVDAAWALVRDQGLAALSLRELAARVGMRAPSLYQYFPSKHAIYDAMFKEASEAALAADPLGLVEGDFEHALHRGARDFFDFAVSDPARAQLLFQRTIPGFEPSPEAYAPAVAMVERLRAAFVAHGITDADAVDLWTALVSGLINQQLANDPGGDRWARLIDRVVDMFLSTMQPERKKGDGNENR